MRRVAVILGLCALLLPMAAWASGIDIGNQVGTVTITNAGIVSKGSQLTSWGAIVTGVQGSVSFSTGALLTGTILGGGTFAGGGTFDIVGVGSWAVKLTAAVGCGAGCPLFTGSFVGPVSWTVVSHTGINNFVFELSGTIAGKLNDGRSVTGTTKQFITVYKNQLVLDNLGIIQFGTTNLAVPEPGTLGLLGTGLLGIAGTMRRKLFGS